MFASIVNLHGVIRRKTRENEPQVVTPEIFCRGPIVVSFWIPDRSIRE
jgi:hypothetical protein